MPLVDIVTALGSVVAEIDIDRAPLTADNFLRYVHAGIYDDARFYRSVRADNGSPGMTAQLVQGGIDPGGTAPPLAPIAHESTTITGLTHDVGALSMARWQPGTAGSEFFITIGAAPELDAGGAFGEGYAVFGRVIRGLDIISRIHQQPTPGQTTVDYLRGQYLSCPIPFTVGHRR